MNTQNTIEIIKALTPIIVAILTLAGGTTGYLWYLSNKEKARAEARKIGAEGHKVNMEVEVTLAEGVWKIAGDFERQLKEVRKEFADYRRETDLVIKGLQAEVRTYEKTIKEKDERIDKLDDRVKELETELRKYQGVDVRTEEARDELHHQVDEAADKIKHDGFNDLNKQ